MILRNRAATVLGLAALLLPACAADPDSSQEPDTSAEPTSDAPGTPVEVDLVEGMYDVGGHRLFMSCSGPRPEGSPTVVYLHGWINSSAIMPHVNGDYIRDHLTDMRVCLYDRRNVGKSETVDAVQTHADMLRDMERVLEAGGEEPPYLLMAASFGGLLAYSYLNHHPDQVVGMVLLDTMYPDELKLDRYVKRRYRFVHFAEEDACCSLERNAHYDMIRDLQRFIGKEPDVPVTYLASAQEPPNQNDYGSPEFDARVLEARAAYVDRFSPGRLIELDSPHFMEPVVPREIAEAVREVAALAARDQ